MWDTEYLTLVSNVKTSEENELNTIGQFRTTLSHPLYLSNDDQIGLQSYHLVKSWYELEEDAFLTYRSTSGYQLAKCTPTGRQPIVARIPRGSYDVRQLLFEINRQGDYLVSDLAKGGRFDWVPFSGFHSGTIPYSPSEEPPRSTSPGHLIPNTMVGTSGTSASRTNIVTDQQGKSSGASRSGSNRPNQDRNSPTRTSQQGRKKRSLLNLGAEHSVNKLAKKVDLPPIAEKREEVGHRVDLAKSKKPSLSLVTHQNIVKMLPGTINHPGTNGSSEVVVNIYFDFTPNMDVILGSEEFNTWENEELTHLKPIKGRPVEPVIGRLFVYCDLVDHNRVGDTLTKLLKIISVPTNLKFGEEVHREVQEIQYFKPSVKEVREVEIDIRTDSGKPVHFQFGRVILTLAIRTRKKDFDGTVLY